MEGYHGYYLHDTSFPIQWAYVHQFKRLFGIWLPNIFRAKYCNTRYTTMHMLWKQGDFVPWWALNSWLVAQNEARGAPTSYKR